MRGPMMKSIFSFLAVPLATLLAAAGPGCGGGDSSGGYDRNAPWGAPTMTTAWAASITRLDGTIGAELDGHRPRLPALLRRGDARR
jgi:hypothetical protein